MVILGLAVLWLVFSTDDPILDAGVTRVLKPILLIVALLCAAGLAILAHRLWLRTPPSPVSDPGPQPVVQPTW